MANTYPTLSRDVSRQDFKEGLAYNPSIQSQAEDGQIISRGRFTSTKKKFEISYTFLTAADKVLLETLQTTVNVSGDVFNWTHPITSTVYSVRLQDPIEFIMHSDNYNEWSANLILIED